jgi:hypothetical protein
MDDDAPAPAIRAVRATLMPDSTIEVELSMPGWDEPQLSVTPPSTDFLNRIDSEPRAINLEGGDRTDELAREHIARHIRQLERRIAAQQRFQRYEQERKRQAAPMVSAYDVYAC